MEKFSDEKLRLKKMERCPLCQSGPETFKLETRVGELKVYACRCQMKFLSPHLDEEEMKRVYDSEAVLETLNPILKNYYSFYHHYKGSRTHRIYLKILSELEKRKSMIYSKVTKKLRVSGRNLLDVGSGNGIFLEVARSKGWNADGLDSSPQNVEFSKSKDLKVTLGNFQEMEFPKEYFDAITLWDVIEHTSNPVGLLQKCFETVKAGGHVVVATPNEFNLVRILGTMLYRLSGGRITGLLSPIFVLEHTLYFSPATLCAMLELASFDIAKVIYDFTDLERYEMNPLKKGIAQLLFWISVPFRLTNRVIVIARKKVDIGY